MTPLLSKIKADHDESLREIFIGYAKLGYSMRFMAVCLGLSRSYVRELCHVYGCRRYFMPANYVKECRGGPTAETWRGGWTKGKRRKSWKQ